jgi:hypothetical protein
MEIEPEIGEDITKRVKILDGTYAGVTKIAKASAQRHPE